MDWKTKSKILVFLVVQQFYETIYSAVSTRGKIVFAKYSVAFRKWAIDLRKYSITQKFVSNTSVLKGSTYWITKSSPIFRCYILVADFDFIEVSF